MPIPQYRRCDLPGRISARPALSVLLGLPDRKAACFAPKGVEPELEHVVATFCKFPRSLEHCGEIPGKEHVIGIPPAVDDADTLISFRHICLQLGSERISNLPSTFGRPIAGV